MKRAWIGLALLSGSWVYGLAYYTEHASWMVWTLLVAVGSLLLSHVPARRMARHHAALALLLVLPAAWVAPQPWGAGIVLLAIGLLLTLLPTELRRLQALGAGAMVAGLILLAQAVTVLAYVHCTARSHDLPAPLVHAMSGIARLEGVEASVDGADVLLHSMRRTHRFAATWDFMFDPASVCFLVGGITFLLLRAMQAEAGSRWREAGRGVAGLLLIMALWTPLHCAINLGFFMHRVMIAPFESALVQMDQLWNRWTYLVFLAGPALLAWRCIPIPAPAAPPPAKVHPFEPLAFLARCGALAAIALAAALLIAGLYWRPAGVAKTGRVVVDEAHSDWEHTQKPMDTEWYGPMSAYQYACIYDYASRFYEMGRIDNAMDGSAEAAYNKITAASPQDLKLFDEHTVFSKIDDKALARCSVLILKTPTRRYEPDEVAAILKFIENGGGVMLIGEHTDVFHTGECLNQIARPCGFSFRYDCLFGFGSPFEESYSPPLLAHPIVQHMPRLDFEISCSIDPGTSYGAAPMVSTGLYNLTADYHASNYYPQLHGPLTPQINDRPDARYGAWIQMWATTYGRGRVVAFTDSTQFSNFSTFEPGKPEEFLGMVDWLNHTGGSPEINFWLIVAAAVFVVVAVRLAWRWPGGWLLVLAAALCGWAVGVGVVQRAHAEAYPLPQPNLPMVRVVMDRSISSVPFPVGGFIAGHEDGFGIFDRWILRLGYFTARATGDDEFNAQLLIVIHPDKDIPDEFARKLQRYVEAGGKLLVIDSPQNQKSTANSLLFPFGLGVDRETNHAGKLQTNGKWPEVPIASAHEVRGRGAAGVVAPATFPAATSTTAPSDPDAFQPFAWIDGKPVGATRRVGKGTVAVIGFGSRFNDVNMGVTGDVLPDPELRKVYDVEYGMLRWLVGQ